MSYPSCLDAWDVLPPRPQAFTIYEEGVSDQRHRITALHSIIGTLHRCHVFGAENRDALVQNAAAYAARLLKRGDQCKAVCACSHLSWQVGERRLLYIIDL